MSFLKSIGLFSTFFIILCLPVDNKMIFDHVTEYLEPYVEKIFGETKKYVSKGSKNAKELGGRLFENVKPIDMNIKKPQDPNSSEDEEDLEEYTHSDKETLNHIFKGKDS